MKVTTVGIDLAKEVFHVHRVDRRGKTLVTRRLKRRQVLQFFTQITPCRIGMEACGGLGEKAARACRPGTDPISFCANPKYMRRYGSSDAAASSARGAFRLLAECSGRTQIEESLAIRATVDGRPVTRSEDANFAARHGVRLPREG